MGNQIRVQLVISGRVQGVMLRQSARGKALELGLAGWAHNLLDGRVEIVCEGEKENIEKFIEWCKKGPPFAKVENVEVQYREHKDEFQSFEIREFGF